MARPIGARDGIGPLGGYPELTEFDGHFLAGFLDGEACFSIIKRRSQSGPMYACNCVVNARRDDWKLLESLAVMTGVGSVYEIPASRTSRPQVSWQIARKTDCLRLAALLRRYPLRGRKALDFDAWAAAVEIWTCGDPTVRKINRDWSGMAYFFERIREVRKYVLRIGFPQEMQPTRSVQSFLAGFVTAESHLGFFRQRTGHIGTRCVIALRGDDLPLLQELRRAFDIGRIRLARRAGANPTAIWTVSSRADRKKLVEILDATPPRGRKLTEYEIWRRATFLTPASPEMSEISAQLLEARKYDLGSQNPES